MIYVAMAGSVAISNAVVRGRFMGEKDNDCGSIDPSWDAYHTTGGGHCIYWFFAQFLESIWKRISTGDSR